MDVPLRGAQCNPKSGRLQSDLHSWLIGRRREGEGKRERGGRNVLRPSVRRRDKKLAESPIRETERERAKSENLTRGHNLAVSILFSIAMQTNNASPPSGE